VERLRLRRGASAVWALNAALVATALALYHHLGSLPAPATAHHVPWWGLAIAFALTEVAVVHVHFRRGAHTLTLAELPLALGLLFAAPVDVMVGWVVGAGIVLGLNRELPRVRLVFNLGQLGVTAGIAAGLFHALSGPVEDPGPRVWAAAVAAVLLAAAVSVLLVGAAMWLSGDDVRPRKLGAMVGMAVAVAATNMSLGLAAGTVVASDPRGVVLLLAPAAAVFLAYRAYTSERSQRADLAFLHEASRTLTSSSGTAPGVAGMLAMALETFRGELAEVCLLPAGEDASGRRITVGPAEHLEIMRPLGAAVGDELAGALADPAARIVTPESLGGALAAHLRRLGAHQVMFAPLQGERKPIGAILMANRTGTGGSFGRADLKLFETLARQTGAALGQDRLTAKVSELRELQRELEHQAFHDPLTGLANRLLFMDRVDHTLKRRQGNAVVLFVDLDDFKPINDTYGHDAGDAVLMAAAERLRGSLRAADTAARLGGDEFAVLLVDIADEHIGVVADRIIDNLLRPLEFGDRTLDVKASLGIATAQSGSGVTADELVRNADVAMYVSKHGGKGRLSHYDATAA
jgi:diguanylate cyclase (GGDEF)-like protein